MTREEKVLQFIAKSIEGTDFEGHVFLAGGAVRDEVMGFAPKDIDLLIDFDNGGIEFANWMTKETNCFVEGSNPVVFPKFGTAKFNLRGTEFDGIDIECVMTRSERYISGSRKPKVEFATIRDDVLRRDFTINSLLKNISTGEILDLTGAGFEDIENGKIHTPMIPELTFKEDPLRMLRAIRFAAKYDFLMTFHVTQAIAKNAHLIEYISFERIQEELNKILLNDRVEWAFISLRGLGLLKFIMPELTKLYKLKQNKFHAWDAWEHTMKTVENTEKNLIARWAALLHDIGKPDTVSETETGIHFYDHHTVGKPIAEKILKRLKFSNDFIDSVLFIVRNHMRFKDVNSDGTGISDKALRKFRAVAGDNIENCLDVMNADNISHGTEWNDPRIIKSIKLRLKLLKDLPIKPKLPVTGFQIMEEFDLESGPEVGKLLDIVADMWFEDPNITSIKVMEKLKKVKMNE